jgi:transposase
VIVAGDEASVYLQSTVQVVWAPVGQTPVVKVDPGRDNTHFYGALDLHTGKEIVMRTTVMKAVSSVLFLLKLVLAYPNQKILLLWDRAPWHHGPAIREFLATHSNFEIFYFPPASPDLNPQEHVWKDARENVTHNHTINQLDTLAELFEAHLTDNTFPCSLLELHDYKRICARFI